MHIPTFFIACCMPYCVLIFQFCKTGVPMRAINRPGSQLLGANGRDDGPIVSLTSVINS